MPRFLGCRIANRRFVTYIARCVLAETAMPTVFSLACRAAVPHGMRSPYLDDTTNTGSPMFGFLFQKIFGSKNERYLRRQRPLVQSINALEPQMQEWADADFPARIADLRQEVQEKKRDLDQLLPEVFAMVREASRRVLGMRHYDVQILGGIVLHKGKIAEMKTGEGKTLVATLPVVLNALSGKGVHVVTVNDYLARRDAAWMGKLYDFLGLSTGVIVHGLDDAERAQAYRADITYGTNNEFGFDYLRDNMKFYAGQLVQRGHNFAIVDEVDSILIDEARTPLIISGASEESVDMYRAIDAIVRQLGPEHYSVDEKARTAMLTDEGVARCEALLKLDNLFDPANITAQHHVMQSLKAHLIFKRDVDYIVQADQVVIVDEFTGRLMAGRRYSDGLHQALEAKERVTIAAENQTLASITFQNYFRLYEKLSGMTGTADTEAVEFHQIYGLEVIAVPPNMPMIRKAYPDLIYRSRQEKFDAIVAAIAELHKEGQPVLVGTISIETSEMLSARLTRLGIPHNVLNAKQHEKEAEIVAQAGLRGRGTIATNMAGRGTDIILGGSREGYVHERLRQLGVRDPEGALPWQLEQAERYAQNQMKLQGDLVRDNFGGLLVIGTERHDSRRIDDQLRGRSGRQGDPGESRFYLSLEDRLLRLYGRGRLDAMSRVMRRAGWGEGEPAEDRRISAQVTKAQERVESMHYGTRKQVLDYDDVMDRQRRAIYAERDAILDGADTESRAIGHARDIIDAIVEETCGGPRRREERDVDGLNAWVGDMTGDGSFDAEKLGEGAGVDELADGIEEVFAERWDAQKEAMGEEAFRELCRQVLLRSLDQHWVDHLVDMDHLKQGVGLRGLAQRDPLVEYKREAFDSFRDLVREIYADFLRIMLRLKVEGGVKADEVVPEEENPFREENLSYSRSGESTIQDDSDLPAMADIAGEVDIEADD